MSTELQEQLEKLGNQSETVRLGAARAILRLAGELTPPVEIAVSEALARETVPWVRGALAEILAGADVPVGVGLLISAPTWDEQLEDLDAEAARRVINLSTRRVLHEVAAVVGRVKLAAGVEFAEAYVGSGTARELAFLSDVCAGLRTLTIATEDPCLVEFDLSQALTELAASVSSELLCPIYPSGPAPFITISDRSLVVLAVRNVLVNAVEATLAVGAAEDERAVVLTWGSSPTGTHATVIDRGPGPPSFLAGLGKAGMSTKKGHPGYGLATASEAMRSLGGTVQIQRNERTGATVVLSWAEDGL
jgi:signal transduction histidine kinase